MLEEEEHEKFCLNRVSLGEGSIKVGQEAKSTLQKE